MSQCHHHKIAKGMCSLVFTVIAHGLLSSHRNSVYDRCFPSDGRVLTQVAAIEFPLNSRKTNLILRPLTYILSHTVAMEWGLGRKLGYHRVR